MDSAAREAMDRIRQFVNSWPPRPTRGGLDVDLIHGTVDRVTDEIVELRASDLRILLALVNGSPID